MTTGSMNDVQLDLVDSVEQAERFLSWLGERRPFDALSIDIETGDKVVSIARLLEKEDDENDPGVADREAPAGPQGE